MSNNQPPRIWLSSPHMGGAEQVFVKEAFDTNWVAPLGPNVDGFERDLQQYTGAGHAAALSSGTAAIHLALIMLDVQPGDMVICQSMTFSATANPIRYLGATPVFIDSEKDTWNMCPDALEEALKKFCRKIAEGRGHGAEKSKVKAILPVHLYGMPAKMDEILAIAEKYDIPVVEDAAEALGSEIHGRRCGSFGRMGILSFNGNKIITTSGGGALLSDDEALIQKARFLATQARDPAPHYQHSNIGFNYRMSNVLAGIGRGQMQVLGQRVEQRRANYQWYQALLAGRPCISLLPEPDGFFANRWLTTILVDPGTSGGITREDIRLAFDAQNIESRPLWKPMHLQPVFQGFPYFGGNTAERLFE
ncbi:MAG TPA: aminotransferase class I/II-fold pyridoxal phosphate-dependent enzyme, partial [Dissulfurispiraceae bacterium]|nr:aminotransferase class I/II-fold pyridoxal phosphate-dependent enzyme [Dissulfurispiraceae bacterium]